VVIETANIQKISGEGFNSSRGFPVGMKIKPIVFDFGFLMNYICRKNLLK
jgi:hypothetical protein